jgi:hypothetical protein
MCLGVTVCLYCVDIMRYCDVFGVTVFCIVLI